MWKFKYPPPLKNSTSFIISQRANEKFERPSTWIHRYENKLPQTLNVNDVDDNSEGSDAWDSMVGLVSADIF